MTKKELEIKRMNRMLASMNAINVLDELSYQYDMNEALNRMWFLFNGLCKEYIASAKKLLNYLITDNKKELDKLFLYKISKASLKYYLKQVL